MEQVFESNRIIFVNPTEELINDYLVMVNDIENVARYIGKRRTPYTVEEERAFIQSKIYEKATMYSMIERKSGDFIGNIEFMDVKDSTAELGIAITASKQSLGYGVEAIRRLLQYGFNTLGLDRVFLKVYPENKRAIHVYEKCGFVIYHCTDEDVFMEILKR